MKPVLGHIDGVARIEDLRTRSVDRAGGLANDLPDGDRDASGPCDVVADRDGFQLEQDSGSWPVEDSIGWPCPSLAVRQRRGSP